MPYHSGIEAATVGAVTKAECGRPAFAPRRSKAVVGGRAVMGCTDGVQCLGYPLGHCPTRSWPRHEVRRNLSKKGSRLSLGQKVEAKSRHTFVPMATGCKNIRSASEQRFLCVESFTGECHEFSFNVRSFSLVVGSHPVKISARTRAATVGDGGRTRGGRFGAPSLRISSVDRIDHEVLPQDSPVLSQIRPRPQASFFWRGHEHSDFLSLEPPRLSDRVREARARQPFLR